MKILIKLLSLFITISTLFLSCDAKSNVNEKNIQESNTSDSSQVSDITQTYGVWDRSGKYNSSHYPFLKGIAIAPKWSEFEPKEEQYQWYMLDETLKKAVEGNQFVYIHLNIGPDSPDWIYDKGVPRVELKPYKQKNGNINKWDSYPYYLCSEYQEILSKTITAMADHIYSLNDDVFNRIIFVQASTGCTGDECAYKGEPLDSKYQISQKDWSEYRIKVFEMYKNNFQRQRKDFYLLFNNFEKDEFPKENSWIQNNIKNIGGKGSVLPRGYNLTGMKTTINELKPFTVSPKDKLLLTRAEMDQSWENGYFRLNLPMNLYWSMLNALDGGLGIWDISKGILDEDENPDLKRIIPTFEFFNKYAGDILPEKANGAFIAFRKGLDSADTVSFPEDKYGDANQNNKERYLNICSEYTDYGAKMDDIEAATFGQVVQRAEQKGFNDCGWDIPSGNYERFITQIEPDKTDAAYWRVGGTITSNSSIYSRFARGFSVKDNKGALYLDVDDKYYSLKNTSAPIKLSIKIIYYDNGKGNFSLKYDSVDSIDKTAIEINKTDSGEWIEKEIILIDAAFENRGINSSDISLVNTDEEDDIFHMIEINKL